MSPSMIPVAEAERLIRSVRRDYGSESVPFESALGRVLATPVLADRDLPPYDRVMMDGIAIRYAAWQRGIRQFRIRGTMAAGDAPVAISNDEECIELMTGAALPPSTDTVIRYEDLHLKDGRAVVQDIDLKKGQSIHYRGSDRQQGAVLLQAGTVLSPADIAIAASVGAAQLPVRRLPRVTILSTGNELVDVAEQPGPYQIRRSNSYALQAALQPFGLLPGMRHLPDDAGIMRHELAQCLAEQDILLISGGVSMGKYDYLDEVLQQLSVRQLFHRVRQRPGKPFWFGEHPGGALVFAFPGNPVSAFMCLYRYFLPWLKGALNIPLTRVVPALLDADYIFKPALQLFLPVSLRHNETGQLLAQPVAGNGSGDFAALAGADAFMELPMEQDTFKKGTPYPVWPFKPLFT